VLTFSPACNLYLVFTLHPQGICGGQIGTAAGVFATIYLHTFTNVIGAGIAQSV
jgi:hypothetical protein